MIKHFFLPFLCSLFACAGIAQTILPTSADTLKIPYTYWSPSGGPFTGLCGDIYSMVFTGTVTKINKPLKAVSPDYDSTIILYTPQEAIIKINELTVVKPPKQGYKKTPGKKYAGQTYFKSDCFFDSGLKEGDKVLVFIYSYEGEYSIPGQSVIKIADFKSAEVLSIEKYIKSGQDPNFIKNDVALWKKHGLDGALKQIIECRQSNGK